MQQLFLQPASSCCLFFFMHSFSSYCVCPRDLLCGPLCAGSRHLLQYVLGPRPSFRKKRNLKPGETLMSVSERDSTPFARLFVVSCALT